MALADNLAIVILAGGRATRLPGKLERAVDGEPLLARVYRHMRGIAPVVIAGAGSFGPELDALLDCPMVVDRRPHLGPLGGLLSAAAATTTEWIFAVAGDAPNVDETVVRELLASARAGDEACVPEHDGCLEPLAALYRRDALEREGYEVLSGDRSMHALLARLKVRRIAMRAERFRNINTFADLGSV